jgi:hypothetical protein
MLHVCSGAAVDEEHGVVQRNDALQATPSLAHPFNVLRACIVTATRITQRNSIAREKWL